ncbi:MAG: ATP-binding protein [Candidatus Aenigmatarchaeota archaeon]
MRLDELNHWWIEKNVKKEFVPSTHRNIFNSVKEDINRRQIQVIVGLRRVGKSTILFQLMDYLIKKEVDPLKIIYCTFDEPEFQGKRIEEILREYSRLTSVDYKKDKVYLFLDEVQKSKRWVDDIKLIYDNLQNIKILVSGSASINILSEAKKNLAGRVIYYELKPLSFEEFLNLKQIKIEKNNFLLYRDILEREFDNFLLRAFPELVNEKSENFIRSYVRNSVIEPIVLKDLPKEFNEVDILLLEDLLNIILSNPGQYLQMDELAKELKRAKTTLYKALFYLEYSFLIRKVLNYRPSIRATSRKLSKIYAYHPCLTLPFEIPKDKFMENLVLFELDTKNYWREKEKEIDFLKDLIPVEVKYKDKIEKQDLKWIKYYMKRYGEKFKIKKSYIITKKNDEKLNSIHFIPLWKFCLFGLE